MKSMIRYLSTVGNFLFFSYIIASCCQLTLVNGFSLPFHALKTAATLRDHSDDAINLFNNMRTPAAMLTGGLVPLGLITAPAIEQGDTKFVKMLKKANILLAVSSLLSEIIAVTYSSIAINKLVEVPSPKTAGVAELLKERHELAWLGTNIHFLYGMMGFGLIVGNRVYLAFGNPIGKLAIGFSVSFFLQALSVVNKGIAMGSTDSSGINAKFASNFVVLTLKYMIAVAKSSTGNFCSFLSLIIAIFTIVQTVQAFFQISEETPTTKLTLMNPTDE